MPVQVRLGVFSFLTLGRMFSSCLASLWWPQRQTANVLYLCSRISDLDSLKETKHLMTTSFPFLSWPVLSVQLRLQFGVASGLASCAFVRVSHSILNECASSGVGRSGPNVFAAVRSDQSSDKRRGQRSTCLHCLTMTATFCSKTKDKQRNVCKISF